MEMERARETGALYCGRHTTLRRTLPESIIGNVFFSFFIMTSSSYLCGAASEARERRWTVHFFSPWLARAPSPLLLYFWSCRGRSTRCLGWRSSSPWHRWGAPRCCTKSIRSSASPRKASCSSTSPPRLPLKNKQMFQMSICLHVEGILGKLGFFDFAFTWILVWHESIRDLGRAFKNAVVVPAWHVALCAASRASQWWARVPPAKSKCLYWLDAWDALSCFEESGSLLHLTCCTNKNLS